MTIRRGENIYASEIAAAFVILRKGTAITEEDIRDELPQKYGALKDAEHQPAETGL